MVRRHCSYHDDLEFFKIQQDRESNYSKSSKTESELLKIQQETERIAFFKIQQDRERIEFLKIQQETERELNSSKSSKRQSAT